MATTRVVLADDHPIVRASLCRLLEKAPDIEVVGEASNGMQVLHLIEDLAPDVLLLDMEMPGLKGVEVVRHLQAAKSPVRILALSAYDDKEYILELLTNGVSGYLIKGEAPQTIIEAVRGVAHGEQGWVSRQIATQIATWTQKEAKQTTLTEQEEKVLHLMVKGQTNQEIGLALGISEKTVDKHLNAIFTKLKVITRIEAAIRAIQEGLI